MSVKPLNHHYSMTNAASVYDEEAMTALELAGRTAAKVNENVEAFNQLEQNTIERLTAQEKTQIPENVASEVKKYVDNGTFDETIEKHIGNLETRIDNLTKNVVPGSTTGDVELYDTHTGRKANESYESAGDAIRAKANLTDINRFFDGDLFTGQAKNLYPYEDHSFTYPGSVAFPPVSNDEIEIAPGNYIFVVTDTNALRMMLTYRTESETRPTGHRILDITNPRTGVYYFTVPAQTEKCYARVYYGSNESAPVAGNYYFKKAYIFPKDSVKIPREFVNKGASIFDCVELIKQKGENLYNGGNITPVDYDGVSLNVSVQATQQLAPGDYLIKIANVLPRVLITLTDNTRVLDESNMSENAFYKFTIPEGHSSCIITGYIATSSAPLLPAGKYTLDNIIIISDNGLPFLPDYLTRYNEIVALIGNGTKTGGKFLSAVGNITAANGMLEIEKETHVKKNYSISFDGLCGAFSGLRVGIGKTSYNGCYAEITATNITIYNYLTAPVQVSTTEHGLTIADFINVNINNGEEKATITITTSTGSYTIDNVKWSGCNGKVFAESMGGTFNNCAIRWTSSDLDKKVWVFGDSYFSLADNRLLGQLFKRGYKNYLVSGYPGASAKSGLTSLETLLTLSAPDVIIYCLGMNNTDNNAINNVWLENVNKLKQICTERDITLILATIPNVPTVDNTYKNTWVKNSGYRYIDFSGAVNTSGATWYADMLSSDNVHPSELGASVLVGRMLNDAPEIMR